MNLFENLQDLKESNVINTINNLITKIENISENELSSRDKYLICLYLDNYKNIITNN